MTVRSGTIVKAVLKKRWECIGMKIVEIPARQERGIYERQQGQNGACMVVHFLEADL